MKTKNSIAPRTLMVLLSFAFTILAASAAFGAVQTVTNTNNAGAGSLRQAVIDAVSGDTIRFNLSGCPCTITLTSGQISIAKTLTLQGPGANVLTISGNNASRILDINGNVNVNVSGLTLANGRTTTDGAAIRLTTGFTGTLFVDRTAFLNNEDVSAFGQGGAFQLSDAGTAIITNSLFSGNRAYEGGAIHLEHGQAAITNTTISGNTATGPYGGGLSSWENDLVIKNSTITANGSTGTGPYGSGGGLIHTGSLGKIALGSSLVAGNTGDVPDASVGLINGAFVSDGYNLIGKNTGSAAVFPAGNPNANNDIVGTGGAPVDPLLGPLANNGGPTQTRALLAGSLAINNGSAPADAFLDQRGMHRRIGSAPDIGAFETQTVATVTNTNDSGPGSLRAAVAAGDYVNFDLTGCPCTITLTSGEIFTARNVMIDGPGAKLLTVSGNNLSRIFTTNFGLTTVLQRMAFTNGNSIGSITPSGGAIVALGNFLLSESSVINNTTRANGGGLIHSLGYMRIERSTISGNVANGPTGGVSAISIENASADIVNSTISGNSGNSPGFTLPTIYVLSSSNSGTVRISNSTIAGNTGAAGKISVNSTGSGLTANVIVRSSIFFNAGGNLTANASSGGSATITSEGFNLSNDSGNGFLTATSDIRNTNPLLGALADNGGPTMTQKPLPGSPVLDKGSSFGQTVDQRGESRPFDLTGIAPAPGGDNTDIGAFELAQAAPAAIGDGYSTPEDTQLPVSAPGVLGNDLDADSDALTAVLVAGPAHGSSFILNGNGSFNYTPAADYSGPDSFTYYATDGYQNSNIVTVSITVDPVNDAPTITTLPTTTATEDVQYSYDADSSDIDGPQAIWSLNTPTHTCGGTINASSGLFTFTSLGPVPPANCVLSIKVRDAGSPEQSAIQTVTISITAVNDAPVISSAPPIPATEDIPYTYNATKDDPDGPGAVWSTVAGNSCGGTITPATGVYSFTPLGPVPPASCVVAIQVCDSGTPNLCATQSTTIPIVAVNDPPTITTASGLSRVQGTSAVSQVANVADPDNATNTLVVTVNGGSSATVNGVTVSNIVVNANGSVTATIAAACGASNASFTVRVTDPGNLFAQATLVIMVTPETTPPVINPIANVVALLPVNTNATSMPVSFPLPTATDNCGPVTVTTNPVSGSVFQLGTTVVNTTATDANGNASTATFTVTVQYPFTGFGGRVVNPPGTNYATAGNTVPLTFSLGGDRGLSIFAPNSPSSQQANCSTWAPFGASSPTTSVPPLTFGGGQYTYYWTTNSAWTGTCRIFSMSLKDGTTRTLNFSFFN